MREDMAALSRTLKTLQANLFYFRHIFIRKTNWFFLQNCKGKLLHVESRPSHNQEESQFEVIIKLEINRENLISLLKLLKQSAALTRVTVASASNPVAEIPGDVN